MSVKMECAVCDSCFNLRDEMAKKQLRCPSCQEGFLSVASCVIPPPPAVQTRREASPNLATAETPEINDDNFPESESPFGDDPSDYRPLLSSPAVMASILLTAAVTFTAIIVFVALSVQKPIPPRSDPSPDNRPQTDKDVSKPNSPIPEKWTENRKRADESGGKKAINELLIPENPQRHKEKEVTRDPKTNPPIVPQAVEDQPIQEDRVVKENPRISEPKDEGLNQQEKEKLKNLVAGLANKDATTRRRCATEIGKFKAKADSQARKALCRTMCDQIEEVRITAADALKEIDTDIYDKALLIIQNGSCDVIEQSGNVKEDGEVLMPLIVRVAHRLAIQMGGIKNELEAKLVICCLEALSKIGSEDNDVTYIPLLDVS